MRVERLRRECEEFAKRIEVEHLKNVTTGD
jgi:hypothetical protein